MFSVSPLPCPAETLSGGLSQLNTIMSKLKFEVGTAKTNSDGNASITLKNQYTKVPIVLGTFIASSGDGYMVTISSLSTTSVTLSCRKQDNSLPPTNSSIYYLVISNDD